MEYLYAIGGALIGLVVGYVVACFWGRPAKRLREQYELLYERYTELKDKLLP